MSDTPRLDDQLCFQLYTASRLVVRAYRPLLAPLGLTYAQYVAMLVLWEEDERGHDVTVSQLGRRLHLDSGTLTPLLKRLQDKGVVTRRRDVDDERVVRVAVTDAGRELATKAAEIPQKLVCELDTPLDAVIELREQLRQFVDGQVS